MIIKEEVERAIKKLKANKSCGMDNIPDEALKAGGELIVEYLHHIVNRIWITGD